MPGPVKAELSKAFEGESFEEGDDRETVAPTGGRLVDVAV